MSDPLLLRLRGSLERGDAVPAHVVDHSRDPLDVLLDRHGHVAEDRRRARAGDHEHVRETGSCHTEVRDGPGSPVVLQLATAATTDIDLVVRAGHGIEARGEHDDVELVVGGRRPDAGGRDLVDGRLEEVDERDVRTVVGVEVVGIDERTLRGKRMVGRAELLRDDRVLHDLGDLPADEVGRGLVGLEVDCNVGKGVDEELEAAFLPRTLVGGLALCIAHGHRGDGARVVVRTTRRPLGLLHDRVVVALHLGERLLGHRSVAGGHRVVRVPLEHVEVAGSLRNDGDRLDTARTRTDDAHALAAEVDALVRPRARVVRRPTERLTPLDVRHVRR